MGQDYDVETAASASEVLQRYKQGHIDMLVLDYLLPGGANGGDLLKHLADPFGSLYVVMLSGADDLVLAPTVRLWQERHAGRFRFLKKPVQSALHVESELRGFLRYYNDRPLPHPLESNLKKFRQYETQQARLKAMQGFLEAALKVSAFLLAANLRERGVAVPALERGFAQSLTLSPWIQLVKGLSDAVSRDESWSCYHLRDAVTNSRHGLLRLSRALKPLRDDELGHGEVGEEDRYRHHVEQHLAELEALIGHLGCLRDSLWVVPEHVDIPEATDGFDYRFRILMGATLPFQAETVHLKDRLASGRVVAIDRRRQRLSLHPMVRWAICGPCGANRLFLLDHYESGQGFTWRASCNHKVNPADWTTEMLALNAKLVTPVAPSP